MAHQDPSSWKEIFTPLAASMAFFGGLGGLVRALVVKATWRETLRVIAVGAGTSFGLGAMTPGIVGMFNIPLPEDPALALGFTTSFHFIIGLIAVAVVEWLIERSEGRDD
jgi:hypothetical protein